MLVRTATPADLPLLHAADRAAFGADAYDRFALRQLVDLFPGLALIALDDAGAPLGFGIAGIEPEARIGWILAVGVAAGARGRGLGEKLSATLLSALHDRGVARVRLTVEATNAPARTIYARLGFVVVADVRDYYGPGADRLVMERRAPAG